MTSVMIKNIFTCGLIFALVYLLNKSIQLVLGLSPIYFGETTSYESVRVMMSGYAIADCRQASSAWCCVSVVRSLGYIDKRTG